MQPHISINYKKAKILRLVSGEEICCMFPLDQLPESSTHIRLQDPLLIKYVPQVSEQGISDFIALVRWVGFTKDSVMTIPKDKIITICDATVPFTNRYIALSQSLKTVEPPLPSYVQRDLTEEDFKRLDKEIKIQQTRDTIRNIKAKRGAKLEDMFDYGNMPSKKLH